MANNNLGRTAIIYQGAHNPATPYVALDCVSLNGSMYLSIQPSTNKDPETEALYWTLMAEGAYAMAVAGGYIGSEADFRAAVAAIGDYATQLSGYEAQLDGYAAQIAVYEAQVAAVEIKADAMASGSPKGRYATLVALEAALPTGDTGAYLVEADSHLYFWNSITSAWVDGGEYNVAHASKVSLTDTGSYFPTDTVEEALQQAGDIITIKPNGVDDTTAIQAALTAGRNVKLTSGVYKITTKLTVTSAASITGEGPKCTLLYFYGCDGIDCGVNYARIRDIGLITNGTTYTALKLSAEYLTVSDIFLGGVVDGINYWTIGLHLVNVWYSNFRGISIFGGNIADIFYGTGIYSDYSVNNSFYGITAIYLNKCFDLSDVAAQGGNYNEGWLIADSTIAACNYGIYIGHCNYINVNNNVIDMMRNYCVRSNGNVCITGNWFNILNGIELSVGVLLIDAHTSVVSNNYISNANIGIESNSYFCTISGNILGGCSDTGIHQASPGEKVSITGNSFVNNINYDILCEGANCSISGHSMDSKIKWTQTSVAIQSHTKICFTTVFALTGGSPQEVKVIAIPLPLFAAKPLAQIDMNGEALVGVYNYDSANSTATQLEFTIYSLGGGNITGKNYRATIFLSADDLALCTA